MLEIIGFDIEGCLVAQAAGANRIELCADPHLGGTSPSESFIRAAVAQLDIPVYVMVRPRGGNFCYTAGEVEEMKETISLCKSIGCAGVVFGILTPSANINIEHCAQLVSLAQPMGVTFHRAFDVVNQPLVALEQIIELGFERILTSGQKPTALEGADLIRQCIEVADNRIVIMPGSGVTSDNLLKIRALTGTTEFHSSAKMSDPITGLYAGVYETEVQKMYQLLMT
jgi:copper homeostasis protein